MTWVTCRTQSAVQSYLQNRFLAAHQAKLDVLHDGLKQHEWLGLACWGIVCQRRV